MLKDELKFRLALDLWSQEFRLGIESGCLAFLIFLFMWPDLNKEATAFGILFTAVSLTLLCSASDWLKHDSIQPWQQDRPLARFVAVWTPKTLYVRKHVDILKQGRRVWSLWRKMYPAASPDLRNSQLGLLDLSGLNLSRANLAMADLSESRLTGVDLQEADLWKAKLVSADLSCSVLENTNLSGCTLTRSVLVGASLKKANLSSAVLFECAVTDDQLSQTSTLFGTIMPDGSFYDGRFRLELDTLWAENCGVDIDDPKQLCEWHRLSRREINNLLAKKHGDDIELPSSPPNVQRHLRSGLGHCEISQPKSATQGKSLEDCLPNVSRSDS